MSKFDPRIRKPVDKCGVTKKRRFRSMYQAAAIAMKLDFRVYFCKLCGGYHLTSRKDTDRAIESALDSSPATEKCAKIV